MASSHNIIHIEPLAPSKPVLGAPCNGCGVCCLAQPCPIGMVLSGRRHGSCVALQWNAAARLYRCGAIVQPAQVLDDVLPAALRGTRRLLAPVLSFLAHRSIALDMGCDSDLEVSGMSPPGGD